jgi:glyceraldehyde-3-phosphate dehydrogenase/erythrose-4-phosphate dehydrogenase
VEDDQQLFRLVSWYDNEWGFSNRIVDLVQYIGLEQKHEIERRTTAAV